MNHRVSLFVRRNRSQFFKGKHGTAGDGAPTTMDMKKKGLRHLKPIDTSGSQRGNCGPKKEKNNIDNSI